MIVDAEWLSRENNRTEKYAASHFGRLRSLATDGGSGTRDLLEVIEDRFGVGSTISSAQLPVGIADAVLDRLVHNA